MDAAAEITIRSLRSAFNRAIAAKDTTTIAAVLARDCVMVTGTDSAVISGRHTQIKVWRREFVSGSPTIYVRATETVAVSSVESIALESGHWHGTDATSGTVTATGTYAAKWRETKGQWLIEAEIFVTLG